MNTKPRSSIYFARTVNWNGVDLKAVKIGLASDPHHRVKQVGAQAPFSCELVAYAPGDYVMETFIHMWFRKQCLRGEFFRESDELSELISTVKRTGEIPYKVDREGDVDWRELSARAFMERHRLTSKDVERETGVAAGYFDRCIEKVGANRRTIAALSVVAVRRSLKVHWPQDFAPQDYDAHKVARAA